MEISQWWYIQLRLTSSPSWTRIRAIKYGISENKKYTWLYIWVTIYPSNPKFVLYFFERDLE